MTVPSHIIWLASFPKSGNTWFRIFLANLTKGDAEPADINNLDERGGIAECPAAEIADHRRRFLLRARSKRPRCRCAAEQHHELAPPHSMTTDGT